MATDERREGLLDGQETEQALKPTNMSRVIEEITSGTAGEDWTPEMIVLAEKIVKMKNSGELE